jgi:long-chain acyl-CoA synthetase
LTSHYVGQRFGTQITCVADGRAIVQVLPDTRPTIWFAVPRIWDKLKLAVESWLFSVESEPPLAQYAEWAIATGLRKVCTEQAGRTVSPELAAAYRTADERVFAPARRRFGLDHMRWAMSGAAPVQPEVLTFFLALGVTVCEVWGMSETVGATTVNPPEAIKVGTVGIPLPGLQLRVAADGEALVRGDMVMRGYRNDPQRTAEVLDADGWLHTGDIVTQGDDGYVRIIDRKKELIINAAGKNMSPANIENTILASCPLIGNVVVIGDGRPYNVALIVLDPDAVAAMCREHDLAAAPLEQLAVNPVIVSLIEAAMDAANTRLSRVERIKRYTILPDQWVPGGAELTPTFKLRRRALNARYAAEIDELYRGDLR